MVFVCQKEFLTIIRNERNNLIGIQRNITDNFSFYGQDLCGS